MKLVTAEFIIKMKRTEYKQLIRRKTSN